ncbi:DUF2252 domain-containing protein [Microbacterium sp. P05]|uniref:DUF2252 domain-containing protein n=1 Tax=Microbacterium sp. P05 TaxID=3366948 RepID=UPI00374682C7
MTSPAPDLPHASPPSTAEGRATGRGTRQRLPRRDLATLTTTGRDPLSILTAQNAPRVPELVPLRIQRMAASPFAFYRGAAAVMAADLARDQTTGIVVASCGDAHVANFGFYASPQRSLVFDLNDFDEAAWAPWEWDLKRLVTSIVLAGGETSRSDQVVREAAGAAVITYARVMDRLVDRDPVARYFEHFSPESLMGSFDPQSRAVLGEAIRDAKRRTGGRAVRRLTVGGGSGGRLAFTEQPPTMVHLDAETTQRLLAVEGDYRTSVNIDVAVLLEQYSIVDVARRVVGVGSVGTRCYLVLLQDGDAHALILQGKEAVRSVLDEYGNWPQPPALTSLIASAGQGARVVSLQRVLQAVSDPFLGHVRSATDFYLRQLHDMKGGIEMSELEDGPFLRYAQACAATLARAHAQSPNAPAVAGYAGSGRALAGPMVEWAFAYADLTRADHAAFVAANRDAVAQATGASSAATSASKASTEKGSTDAAPRASVVHAKRER